jgi:hypothetical protein
MARQKKPADAVQFTYESAERIANVVRAAELTPPSASPLTFDRRIDGRMPKLVRAATFSGSWAINSAKVVTFKYAPTATVSATNLSWPITSTAYSNEDCLVGREGTSWWLVVPKLEARTASFITSVSVSATLNTNTCAITVHTTASISTATFLRVRVP